MATINKTELANRLALMDVFSNQSKKATNEFINGFFQLIADEIVAGNEISIAGFGKFENFTRENGKKKAKFTAFTALKNAVNA